MQGTNLKDVCNKNCATTISSSKTVFRFFRPITLFWRTSPPASWTSGPDLLLWASNLYDCLARTSVNSPQTRTPLFKFNKYLFSVLSNWVRHSYVCICTCADISLKLWRVRKHSREPNLRARHHCYNDFAATRYVDHSIEDTTKSYAFNQRQCQ